MLFRIWFLCIFLTDHISSQIYSLAGLGSGVTEAILVNPFEVVKVKMQSNRAHQTEAPKTFVVAREILKEDGYFGRKGGNGGLLNKGITGTMGRNGVFNMVYFGFYHSVKNHFPAYSVNLHHYFNLLICLSIRCLTLVTFQHYLNTSNGKWIWCP